MEVDNFSGPQLSALFASCVRSSGHMGCSWKWGVLTICWVKGPHLGHYLLVALFVVGHCLKDKRVTRYSVGGLAVPHEKSHSF